MAPKPKSQRLIELERLRYENSGLRQHIEAMASIMREDGHRVSFDPKQCALFIDLHAGRP